MKRLNKIVRAILYPHIAILILLVPISAVATIFLAIRYSNSPFIYILYALDFYLLVTTCLRIPNIIKVVRSLNQTELVRRLKDDAHLRIKASLYFSLIFNGSYALIQLVFGFLYSSFWFYSMAFYYIILALVRFFLLHHTRMHKAGERMRSELIKYRFCGYILLVMNMALAIIVFFMVYWNRALAYNEIMTITLATYTFASFSFSIVSLVRYKKFKSPIYSAVKLIGVASACVSILTLEATMLSSFGGSDSIHFNQIMLACTGGAVSAVLVAMAIYMMVDATKGLKKLKTKPKT
ncbi:MAG: hypothetical protein IJZ04_06945 [Clostridia bacterium]|nr:hypothetical protein [Clostridia bacterium]